MYLIPAIDLKDGHCVRLKQGDMDQSTIFGEDPAQMALNWVAKGARRLHLVDLNGAFAGTPQNKSAIKAILKAVGHDIPVQLGGGIRDLDTIEKYIDAGLQYVIIGTAAVKNPGFLKDACAAFGGHIIVGLDAKDGKVATDGWSKLTGHDVADLGKKFEDYGVESIIYTDIGRDGMLTGINIDATVKLAQAVSIPIIASGGLSNMADIEQLCAVEDEGVEGVICGRAIYSGDSRGRIERLIFCPHSPLSPFKAKPATSSRCPVATACWWPNKAHMCCRGWPSGVSACSSAPPMYGTGTTPFAVACPCAGRSSTCAAPCPSMALPATAHGSWWPQS
jgi:phosphoribosylformimino-5-aminoimidazole carboxamide ribotide isomerase